MVEPQDIGPELPPQAPPVFPWQEPGSDAAAAEMLRAGVDDALSDANLLEMLLHDVDQPDENVTQSLKRGLVEGGAQTVLGPGQAFTQAVASTLGIRYDPADGYATRAINALVDAMAPEQDTIAAQGSQARLIGQTLGQLGGMVVAGALGGPLATGTAAFGMSANEAAGSLRDSGVDDGTMLGAMAVGGAIGVADMLPAGRVLRRLNVASGGRLGASLGRVDLLRRIAGDAPTPWRAVREIGYQTGLGAFTEASQAMAMNALVAHATDQDLDLLRGAGQEAEAGGIAGGFLSTLVELATGKRRLHQAHAAKLLLKDALYWEQYRTDPEFAREADAWVIGQATAEAADNPQAQEFVHALEMAYEASTPEYMAGIEADILRRRMKEQGFQEPAGEYAAVPPKNEGVPAARPAPKGAVGEEHTSIGFDPEGYTPGGSRRGPARAVAPEPDEVTSGDYSSVGHARGTSGIAYRTEGGEAVEPLPPRPAPKANPTRPIDAIPPRPTVGSKGAYQPFGTHESGATLYEIDNGMTGTADNVVGARAPTTVRDVTRPLLRMLEALGAPVRILHRADGPVVGLYHPGAEVQIKRVDDVETLAHEAGHAIHRLVMDGALGHQEVAQAGQGRLATLEPTVQAEIEGLAYKGTPAGQELQEGFSELVRMYVARPEVLAARAPKAARWLETWMVSDGSRVRKDLQEAKARAEAYRFQGDDLRRQTRGPETFWSRTLRAAALLPRTILERVYEEAYAAREADRRLERQGKGPNTISDIVRANRGNAQGMTHSFVDGTPVDLAGNEIAGTKNLREILRPLSVGEYEAFNEYLLARRTLALEKSPKPETGKSPAQALRTIELYNRDKPHFERMADDLQRWWGAINMVLAQASPTYASEMQKIGAYDEAYGVDFYVTLRYLNESAKSGGRGGSAGLNKVSREREGAFGMVKNPLEAFVQEARSRFQKAYWRNTLESLYSLHVASDGVLEPWISEDRTGGQPYPDSIEAEWEGLIDVFSSPKVQAGQRIPAKVRDAEGKIHYLQIDAGIAKLAAQVDPNELRAGMGFLAKMVTWPMSLSRLGLVTFQIINNPAFQFFTNLLYDIPTTYLVSEYYKPSELPLLMARTAKNIALNTVYEIARTSGRKDWIPVPRWPALHEQLGLHQNTRLDNEFNIGRKARSLARGEAARSGALGKMRKITSSARVPFEVLASFMSIPQRAVQIANMEAAARKHKIDIMRPISMEQAQILRRAGRQPVDYTAGGDLSRFHQAYIPFLRAYLDTQKQMVESGKRNPIEFAAKAGYLMAIYTAWYALFGDDDVDEGKSTSEMLRTISTPIPGTDEVLELRVPNELSFMLLPVVALRSLGKSGVDVSEFVRDAIGTVAPPTWLDNPLVHTTLQQMTGKQNPIGSVFSGSDQGPIVPGALEGKSGIEQRTPATAPAAIAAAEGMNRALSFMPENSPLRERLASPVRWESAIRSLLGGNALAMVEGFGLVPGLKPEREYELGEGMFPGILRKGGRESPNSPAIREVYNLADLASQQKADLDGRFEDPSRALLRSELAGAAATLSTMSFLAQYEQEGMTVKGRRAIAQEMNVIAQSVLADIKAGRLPLGWRPYSGKYQIRRELRDMERGAFFR